MKYFKSTIFAQFFEHIMNIVAVILFVTFILLTAVIMFNFKMIRVKGGKKSRRMDGKNKVLKNERIGKIGTQIKE